MKTQEERDNPKREFEALHSKFQHLTEEELKQVNGGGEPYDEHRIKL